MVLKMLRRKAYDALVNWKNQSKGSSALLVEGVRRVGKTTLVSEFAKQEYDAYLLIDFSVVPNEVRELFENYRHDVSLFLRLLQAYYGVILPERKSLIVFDEVQRLPIAREFIKHLVADGRFDYIETGSLISIKRNVEDILIPSEERSMELCPLDFEEFLWAEGEEMLAELVRDSFKTLSPLPAALHRKAERLFREYMLVGGMPQAVEKYIETQDFGEVDDVKRQILKLYQEDVEKYANGELGRVQAILRSLPGQLARHEKRFVFASLGENIRYRDLEGPFTWLDEAKIVNLCRNVSDPSVGLAASEQDNALKCYLCDTGLLISHMFADRPETPHEVYRDILFDKLEVNEGMFTENVVAQQLRASGRRLFFYSANDRENADNTMEIDFLIVREYADAGLKPRVSPIEVKSSKRYWAISLDKFKRKFGKRVGTRYVLHPKPLVVEEDIVRLPLYIAHLL